MVKFKKILSIITLLAVSIIILSGCDPDFWTGGGTVYDKDELLESGGTSGPTVQISYKSTNSYTINGFNFSYCIDNAILSVGDTLKITVNSTNDVSPWVKILIDAQEKLYTSELPADYESIVDSPRAYEIGFEVFDHQQVYQFTVKTGVTVK